MSTMEQNENIKQRELEQSRPHKKVNMQSSDKEFATLLKKMRLYKKLTREEAANLFPFSYKNIERIENGRAKITQELFKQFQQGYDISEEILHKIIGNQITVSDDANSIRVRNHDPRRKSKRFRQRIISRECAVLKELRLLRNLEQGQASTLCGFSKRKVGFIENGRISLTKNRIEHMVISYGFTMEYFNQLLKLDLLRHELIERSIEILKKLDDNKLRILYPMLTSMAG